MIFPEHDQNFVTLKFENMIWHDSSPWIQEPGRSRGRHLGSQGSKTSRNRHTSYTMRQKKQRSEASKVIFSWYHMISPSIFPLMRVKQSHKRHHHFCMWYVNTIPSHGWWLWHCFTHINQLSSTFVDFHQLQPMINLHHHHSPSKFPH